MINYISYIKYEKWRIWMERENESDIASAKGIFSNHKRGAKVLKAGANFLKREWFDEKGNSFQHIKRVKVIFSSDVVAEEFENDFGNKLATIYAPIIQNESEEEKQNRHRFLIKYYGNGIQEAHLGIVTKFISLLSPEAQKNLVKAEKNNGQK